MSRITIDSTQIVKDALGFHVYRDGVYVGYFPKIAGAESGPPSNGNDDIPRTPPADPPPAGGTGTGSGTGDQGDGQQVTLTSGELRRRLEGARGGALKRLLQALGLDENLDVEQAVTQAAQIRTTQQTEEQRRIEAAKAEGRTEAQRAAEQQVARANRALIRSHAILAADDWHYPDTVMNFLAPYLTPQEGQKESRVRVAADGETVEGLEAALKEITEKWPKLLKGNAPLNGGGDRKPRGSSGGESAAEIAARKNANRAAMGLKSRVGG